LRSTCSALLRHSALSHVTPPFPASPRSISRHPTPSRITSPFLVSSRLFSHRLPNSRTVPPLLHPPHISPVVPSIFCPFSRAACHMAHRSPVHVPCSCALQGAGGSGGNPKLAIMMKCSGVSEGAKEHLRPVRSMSVPSTGKNVGSIGSIGSVDSIEDSPGG
jgi:hypothetical protein